MAPKILIVEDNEINSKVVSMILKKHNFLFDIVENGLEAIDAWKGEKYDVILMDCQMPVMDGYEATRRIRQLESNSIHIPIIAVTAHSMPGDREKCIDAGMDDYLTKPVNCEKLHEVITKYLAK